MTRGQTWRRHLPWLGLPLSGVFLMLAFAESDLGEIARTLADANLPSVILAATCIAGSYFLMALRWRLLLRPVAQIGLVRALALLMVGYLVNYLLPGRLGELVRSYLVGTFAGASRTAALAVVLVEKVVDGLVLLACLAILLRLIPLPSGAGRLGLYGSAIFVGAGAGLIALRLGRARVRWLAERTVGQVPRVGRQIVGLIDAFEAGLATVEVTWRTAQALALSVAIWVAAALAFYALTLALGLAVPPYAALVLLVGVALSSMVPSAPGFVGTYQLVTVAVLAGFGVARNEALALSVLLHATEYALVLAGGLAGLAVEGVSFGRLLTAAREEEPSPRLRHPSPAERERGWG